MDLEKRILSFIKAELKELEIARINGLVKTDENEWSFRYTFRDVDYLKISNLTKIKMIGKNKKIVFIRNPIIKNKNKIIKTVK